MAHFVWDLGFNFDHLPNKHGSYDLQLGLVTDYADAVTDWNPASPYKVGSTETVTFLLYDLTDGAQWDDQKDVEISNPVVNFSKAREGDPDSPFSAKTLNPNFARGDGYGNPSKKGAYFSKVHPVYYCKGKEPDPIEDWTILYKNGEYHCNMDVEITIKKYKKDGTFVARTFVVDPEMVIDSQGGLDPKS